MNRFIPTLLAACVAVSPVAAATCGNAALIDDYLRTSWGETQVGVGYLSGSEDLVVFYANKKTETWSFVRVDEDGISCVVSSGTGWVFTIQKPNT